MSATVPVPQPHAATQSAPSQAPAQATLPGGETPEQALTRAQTAAHAKRLNEAAGICADVLAAIPEHPAALALQGIVAAMAGDPERGVVLLRKAIGLRPGNPTWLAHLSSLCRMTYRIEEGLAMGQ